MSMKFAPNIVFNLTYLGVTDLAFASSAPPKTQVKAALDLSREMTILKPEITYCLLAEIKAKKSNITSLIEVFEELAESIFANYYSAGAINGILDDLRDKFSTAYGLDVPHPTLKIILTRLKNRMGEKLTLFEDYAFSFEPGTFLDTKRDLTADEAAVSELSVVYGKYAQQRGTSNGDLFSFIEQSKRDLISYLTSPESFDPNNWEDSVIDFVRFVASIEKYRRVFEKLILGSLISVFFELKLENAGVKKRLLLDTNFIVSLMDLHSEESYITTSSILQIAEVAGFHLEVLPETIKETRNLLKKKASKVDRVVIFSSQRKHTIESGCARRKLRGSDLLMFGERIEQFLTEKKVVVLTEETNSRLLLDIEKTEIYKKLVARPFNADGVVHDAVAMRYVKEFRTGDERTFSQIPSLFVTDTAGFLENKITHTTYLPYVIRAEELLNILWLSNPMLDTSVISSNLSKVLSLHLEKKLPDKAMMARIDKKLENYADYGLDEQACVDLASNIAEIDNKQLTVLLNTEEKDQFRERLLDAITEAKKRSEETEARKAEEYGMLLRILEEEKIAADESAKIQHEREVEELKNHYGSYAKLKEKELLDDVINRDEDEQRRIQYDIDDLKDAIDGRFKTLARVVGSLVLLGIVVFIALFAFPEWGKAEVYTYILSLAPLFVSIAFYVITGKSIDPKVAVENLKSALSKRDCMKLKRKLAEAEIIAARIKANKVLAGNLII